MTVDDSTLPIIREQLGGLMRPSVMSLFRQPGALLRDNQLTNEVPHTCALTYRTPCFTLSSSLSLLRCLPIALSLSLSLFISLSLSLSLSLFISLSLSLSLSLFRSVGFILV